MTTTRKLEKTAWKTYFDKISKLLEGRQVEIDIASLNIGSQVAAEWLPLLGISYDEHDDIIAVMAEGLNHMIRKPRDVFVQNDGLDILDMEVINGDGAIELIKFREPLLIRSR